MNRYTYLFALLMLLPSAPAAAVAELKLVEVMAAEAARRALVGATERTVAVLLVPEAVVARASAEPYSMMAGRWTYLSPDSSATAPWADQEAAAGLSAQGSTARA